MEIERLRKLTPLDEPPTGMGPGVLLSNWIKFLCEDVPEPSQMIAPFNQKKLHPAGYKLTVGNQYALNGEIHTLCDEPSACISIEPFHVAIIRTAETLCIPRFLIARWNIVVKHAYKGLLWVGAAQVDPGWVGHLSCPIYNLSDSPVILRLGDDIALMDFVQTTEIPLEYSESSQPEKWERYPFPDKVLLEEYDYKLKSALFTKVAQEIPIVSERQRQLEMSIVENERALDSRITTFSTIIMAALAAIPALLASMMVNQSVLSTSVWGPFTLGFSVFSFLLVLLMWFRPTDKGRMQTVEGEPSGDKRENGRKLASVLIALVVGICAFAVVLWQTQDANARLLKAITLAGVDRVAATIETLDGVRQDQSIEEITNLLRDHDRQTEIGALADRIELIEKSLRGADEANKPDNIPGLDD